jgi:hypothetical protein
LWPYFSSILLAAAGCSSKERAPAPPPFAIEARDPAGVTARLVPGRPCRATVEGVELMVGGPPLAAQNGAATWSAEDAPNGTTFRKNGTAVARFHARQLFDAEGLPILRVLEDGRVADRASAIVREAVPTATGVAIIMPPRSDSSAQIRPPMHPDAKEVPPGVLVSGTDDAVLAVILTAPEVKPELRAILACHRLLTGAR